MQDASIPPGHPPRLWLVRLEQADALAQAARAFSKLGHVVVQAGVEAKGLPPPLPQELEEARATAHPAGYLIRRAVARALAARILGGASAHHRISRHDAGAPVFASQSLHLSFSARDDAGLIALGRAPLGVDLETFVPSAGIPHGLLRAAERGALDALPPARQEAAFLSLWRAKEAALKALGLGFSVPPEAVFVDLAVGVARITRPGVPDAMVRLHDAPEAGITLALA